MIINKEFTAICKICNAPITLYEYKGLEGGRYSGHHCEDRELVNLFWELHPRVRNLAKNVKEVRK